MMETETFDTDFFISEVEKRPAIWNTECPDYKDKMKRKDAWEELVEIYNVAGDIEEKREILAINLQKRWKTLRDIYARDLKKLKNTGQEAKKHSAHRHYARLQFLEKYINNKETTNNFENNQTERMSKRNKDLKRQACNVQKKPIVKITKSKSNEVKLKPDKYSSHTLGKIDQLLSRQRQENDSNEDGDKLFCLSLYKELKKIPEHNRLKTKIELLEVIQRAHNLYYATPSIADQSQMQYSDSLSHSQPDNYCNSGCEIVLLKGVPPSSPTSQVNRTISSIKAERSQTPTEHTLPTDLHPLSRHQ